MTITLPASVGAEPTDDAGENVIGGLPDIEGRRCEAFICQRFVFHDEPVEDAGRIYVRFERNWRDLTIDCGVVLWREATGAPEPWAVEDEGWKYPHVNVGERAGVIGSRLEELRTESTPTGATITFSFENGRKIVIHNQDDRSTFRIV